MFTPSTESPTTMPECRHCHVKWADRARNLCRRCYDDLGIRSMYPLPAKEHGVPVPILDRARCRGVDLQGKRRTVPASPTLAKPGSAEKIRILAERASKGEELWHPKDYVKEFAPYREVEELERMLEGLEEEEEELEGGEDGYEDDPTPDS